MGNSRLRASLVVGVLGTGASVARPAPAATGYVFSTFRNDSPAGEQLSTLRSADALNFTLIADTGFPGASGTLRDPSLMKHADGKYYVAYTAPPGVSCCGKQDHFSVAASADLVHWTNLTTVVAGVPGVAHVWAPEWFVDGSTVHVIANIDTLNNDTDFKPYVFTAQDSTLTAWSGAVPLGFGPNYIDTFVLKARGVYHAFTKNETTRYLEHATAASLTGPWTFVGTGNWSGFGPGMEGPCVVSLDDGTWRIFVDAQNRPITARFLTATSPDLVTWSAPVVLPAWGSLRHGTVIRDTTAGTSPGDAGAGPEGGGTDSGVDAASGDRDATTSDAPTRTTEPDAATDATLGPVEASAQPLADTGDVPRADAAASALAEAGSGAGSPDRGSSGCSCRSAEGHAGPSGPAWLSLGALAWWRRRRSQL